jgi:hypothetical protein
MTLDRHHRKRYNIRIDRWIVDWIDGLIWTIGRIDTWIFVLQRQLVDNFISML